MASLAGLAGADPAAAAAVEQLRASMQSLGSFASA
jgi:hypothetical protein